MLKDMQPQDIVGNFKEYKLELFGGFQRTVYVTEIEKPFPDGKLIVSTTDPEGVITLANQAFVDMSGYTKEELIGAPHSILRHPDMPPAAFKDLWDTIKTGKKWQGYVKNLRKDGGYYWVKAVVIPNVRKGQIVSYTSVRRKPSRLRVEECMKLYPTLF